MVALASCIGCSWLEIHDHSNFPQSARIWAVIYASRKSGWCMLVPVASCTSRARLSALNWATASSWGCAPPVCYLPLFCLQITCLSILVCGHLSHFYHPFMDSVFFFPWEISLYIHLRFCLFFSLCGHYLKVCGPTHLRLVAGRVSAIHDLTPDLMLVWGLGKLLMSHILCGRFWVRILYDDKINLPKSQGRSPTLIFCGNYIVSK